MKFKIGDHVEWGDTPSSYGSGVVVEVFDRVAGYQHLKLAYARRPAHATDGTTVRMNSDMRPLGTAVYPGLPEGFSGWAVSDFTLAGGLGREHDEFCEMEGLESEDYIEQYYAVVLSKNRDSDLVDTCNYDVLVSRLEKACEDERGHVWWDLRFNHWAVGWVDYLLVRVDKSKALEVCKDAAKAILDHPILDEDAYSALECEEANEAWEGYDRREFARALERELGDEDGDDLSNDELDAIRLEMERDGSMTWENRGPGSGICFVYTIEEWLAPIGVSTKRELYEQCKAAQKRG